MLSEVVSDCGQRFNDAELVACLRQFHTPSSLHWIEWGMHSGCMMHDRISINAVHVHIQKKVRLFLSALGIASPPSPIILKMVRERKLGHLKE
jgi:hypothetical protein